MPHSTEVEEAEAEEAEMTIPEEEEEKAEGETINRNQEMENYSNWFGELPMPLIPEDELEDAHPEQRDISDDEAEQSPSTSARSDSNLNLNNFINPGRFMRPGD